MASAAPSPLASSTETTNGTKLRRLLVDGGTPVLRKVFDGIHHPAKLASKLDLHRSTLDDLFGSGILSKAERELLFPPDGSKPDSKKFDITLLFLLLVEICGLSPPRPTCWNNRPRAKDKTREANLVRIKLFRNQLIHTPETRIDTQRFNKLWKEISGVLVALGLGQTEIDRLKAEPCGEEDYLAILFKWADREKDAKLMMKEVRKGQEKMCQTQQEQSALLQDTKQAVDIVCQTQQEHDVLLQGTKQAVEVVSQSQQEHYNLLQNANAKLEEAHQIQQITESKVEAIQQTQSKTHEALETFQADLQEIKQTISSLEEQKNKDMEKEILLNLAKAEFKGDIEYYVRRYQEGTREWVFNKVQNWLEDRSLQSRVMVISANAGMGKSVMSAVICKRMQEAGRLSGSHFCQHNNARYRNPQLMLQSLACHLCHSLPEYKEALVEQLSRNLGKDLNNMGVEELFALLFEEPLSSVADPGRNMLMVIDGLDESEYQERNELLDVIANHFCKLPCWIRFLCTTRPERNIAEKLKQLKPFHLESNDEGNLQDVKLFLGNRTQHLIKPENKGAILEKLVEKSEGLMLHAYFLVSFIEENVSDLDQGYLDGSLPLAISSVYHSYFKRLENELIKELGVQEENFLNLLCAVTASREPLPIGFVSKVLVPDANSPVAKRKVLKAIGSVSSLLPVRDGRLHIIHKSVKDWLTNTSSYEQHSFTVEEKDGHHILSTFCSKELDHVKQKGVCSEQFDDATKYALMHGVQHMLESEGTVSLKLQEIAKKYATDLEMVYAKLSVNNTAASEDLFCVQKQESFKYLCSEAQGEVRTLLFLLRKNSGILREHPRFILQTVVNEGVPVLSSEARSLLKSKYPEIPYIEYIHKGDQQLVVQARFECFSEVLCFDVSPRLDYMVCECEDGTIQLWSINTGNREWKRPVLEKERDKKAYRIFPVLCKEASTGFPCFEVPVMSFYRSVVFHPKGNLVLPGSLCEVYTIAGEQKQLFSKSDCRFSVCTFCGDKTRMLTDCPTNSKCVVMWNLCTGEEVSRIVRKEDIVCFQCSPDGTRLAISHLTGQICLVDLVNGLSELGEISISEACGFMNFFPDNRALACLHLNRWGKCLFRLNIAPGNPFQVVNHIYHNFFPGEFEGDVETAFLVGDTIGNLSKQLARVVPYWKVGFLLQLNDKSALMSSPDLDYLSLVNLNKLKEVRQESQADVTGIRFSIDGSIVYVVSGEWWNQVTVTVWDCSKFECKTERPMWLTSLVPVREGVVLMTCQEGQGITPELWDVGLSERMRQWTSLKGITNVIPISEEKLACVGYGIVFLLSTASDLIETMVYNKEEHILGFFATNKNTLMIASGLYRKYIDGIPTLREEYECRLCDPALRWVKVWDTFDEQYAPPQCMFSPKEEFCIMKDNYRVEVLDADTGKLHHALFKKHYVVDCKFISDSGLIVCSQEYCGSFLRMFDVRSGELLSLIEIEGQPLCLGTHLHSLHIAVGLSGSEFKLLQVHLPRVENNSSSERMVNPPENPTKEKNQGLVITKRRGLDTLDETESKQAAGNSGKRERESLSSPCPKRSKQTAVVFKLDPPKDDDLQKLAKEIVKEWKWLGRRLLGSDEAKLFAIHKENEEWSEKAYQMLLHWRQANGSDATYQVLYNALCEVERKDLAEDICLENRGKQDHPP